MTNRAERLVAGSLAELPLPEVMQVTSLGRHAARVEVHAPAGSLLGTVVLKAGRIASASVGASCGHVALRALLAAPPESQFAVLVENDPIADGAPLGLVADLEAVAVPEPPTLRPVKRELLLAGRFADVDLA